MDIKPFSFFPAVGITETLYSIGGALHHLGGHMSYRASALLYFGNERASTHRLCPSGIDYFCAATHNALGTPTEVLQERSIFGLHMRFMERQDAELFQRALRSGSTRFTTPEARTLRYCAHCVVTDREKLGRGTWRVEHQLPGAEVCMWHGMKLHAASPQGTTDLSNYVRWIRVDEVVSDTPFLYEPRDTQEQHWKWWMANMLWLLYTYEKATPFILRRILATHLSATRVIRAPSFLRPEVLRNWVTRHRQCSLVNALTSHFKALEGNWYTFINHRNQQHPLRWAVVLCLAFEHRRDFENALVDAVAVQSDIEDTPTSPQRSRRDLLPEKVWNMLLQGDSLHRITDEYGFHRPALNHALRVNPEIKIAREQKLAELMLAARRAWVLDTIKIHPEAKRKIIYERHSAIVRWMETHDREWFAAQLAPTDSGRVTQRPLFPVNM